MYLTYNLFFSLNIIILFIIKIKMVSPRTKTSPIWDIFTLSDDNKRAKCNKCGDILSYSSRSGPRNLVLHSKSKKCYSNCNTRKSSSRSRRNRRSGVRRSRRNMRSRVRRSQRSRRNMRSRVRRSPRNMISRVRRSPRNMRSRVRRSRRSPRYRSSGGRRIRDMFTITKNNTRAVCNHCGKIMVYSSKSGPRNLEIHLKSRRCVNY